MTRLRPILAAFLLAQSATTALAADWQLVLSDRNRRVEIDRSSILTSDGGTRISWGRVVLTSEEARASGYAMIKALNRYDCRARSFVTIKRVYVDELDNIVREEPVADQSFLEVTRGSVDERMWREVCDPPSAMDLQKLASEAARVAAGAAVDKPVPAEKPGAIPPAAPAKAAAPDAVKDAKAEPARALSGGITPVAETPAPEVKAAAPDTGAAGPMPAFETHVEIPAKFLPGGQAEAAADTPRKSILPPLPALGPKTAGGGGADPAAAPPAASAPAAPPSAVAAAPARAAAPRSVAAPRPEARAPSTRAEPRAASQPPARTAATAKVATSPAAARPTPRPARTATPKRAPVREAAPASAPRPAAEAPCVTPQPPDAIAGLLAGTGIELKSPGRSDEGWRYDGDIGPERWGQLRPEWRLCEEGRRQSPIDLRDGLAVDLEPVKFHYPHSGFRIRDTGNLLQVEVGDGMGIIVRGVRYALEHFTLHRPSQDRVGGMAHDMAAYFMHRSADGRQAIVSVQLVGGGPDHPVFDTLWANLPLDRGREFTPEAVIDLSTLVPASPAHFLYTGSLPMPPCTEDVLWVVMKEPVKMSAAQLEVFARLYPRNGRPIQPTNGRLVLESR